MEKIIINGREINPADAVSFADLIEILKLAGLFTPDTKAEEVLTVADNGK